jgi:hypothetical protein
MANDLARHAVCHAEGGNVVQDDGAGADNGTFADADPVLYASPDAYRASAPDVDVASGEHARGH